MMRFLFSIVLFIVIIFTIATLGELLLDQFPALEEPWGEIKNVTTELYNKSVVKYGTLVTLILIVGIGALVGTSKR